MTHSFTPHPAEKDWATDEDYVRLLELFPELNNVSKDRLRHYLSGYDAGYQQAVEESYPEFIEAPLPDTDELLWRTD